MRDGAKGPKSGGAGPRNTPRKGLAGDGGGDIGTAMQFGISIILFTLFGSWLDRRFGTAPALLLVGMAVGAAAGFYSMYTKLTAREREAGRKGSGKAGPAGSRDDDAGGADERGEKP
jgi:hypothetical protein